MTNVQILCGDCRDQLKTLPDNSIDSIVTDPPYGLEFMGNDWDAPWKNEGVSGGKVSGFGKADGSKFRQNRGTPSFGAGGNPTCLNCGGDKYRNGERRCTCDNPQFPNQMAIQMRAFQDWCQTWAVECFRVLKPGGHMLAFSGSRTYHRMTCAIEDAGFEIRDQIMWVYGTGFPKSLNISKALDAHHGAERTGGGRVWSGGSRSGGISHGGEQSGTNERIIYDEPASDDAKKWDGWGTALKPAHEPICVARKPLEGTVAQNVLKWGVGGLNIDASRVPLDANDPLQDGVLHDNKDLDTGDADTQWGFKAVDREAGLGRFPANIIHDGSNEVVDLFPSSKAGKEGDERGTGGIWNSGNGVPVGPQYGDNGSAARFFYCAKASPQDRNDGLDGFAEKKVGDGRKKDSDAPQQRGATMRKNTHPTVKPTDLMRYLCRMVTPTGGTILDPFTGSGSTGRGAVLEGFNFIGIEMNSEYIDIARARIGASETVVAEQEKKLATYNNLFEEE